MGKTNRIDFSAKRLSALAEKYYSEGKYVSALRFTYKEIERYGDSLDCFFRLADIYENMGLSSTAINCWFKALDCASEEDYPDIYEGLALNYLNMGKEAQSAFYYNCLIESDEEIPDDIKYQIADIFSEKPKSALKISYPPRLVDYKPELDKASRALKKGDCKNAVKILEKIEKGSNEYILSLEMRALALLLSENVEEAKTVCLEALEQDENNVRALSTLSAAYFEEGDKVRSLEIARKLCEIQPKDDEEEYKIATVCCENGLHLEAFKRFSALERQSPYDGKLLYFKGVSAYNAGKYEESMEAFAKLCGIYPDAAVVEHFLKEVREYYESLKNGEEREKPELGYFYQVSQKERDKRCQFLMEIEKMPKAEAEVMGIFAHTAGLFRWCFDELDGVDHDLQYLACLVAAHSNVDEFLKEILLDNEVLDLLKIEILRLLYERNEETTIGAVVYHVYRKIRLLPISIGRKARKKFISAYARTASKFVVVNPDYAQKIKTATETLYRALEKYDCFEQAKNVDDCACAIYLTANLRDVGKDIDTVSLAFDANADRVRVLLTTIESAKAGL